MLLLEITENEWKDGNGVIENADAGTTIIITPIRHCDGDEKDAIIIAPRRALTIAKWRDTLGDMWWRQRRR